MLALINNPSLTLLQSSVIKSRRRGRLTIDRTAKTFWHQRHRQPLSVGSFLGRQKPVIFSEIYVVRRFSGVSRRFICWSSSALFLLLPLWHPRLLGARACVFLSLSWVCRPFHSVGRPPDVVEPLQRTGCVLGGDAHSARVKHGIRVRQLWWCVLIAGTCGAW